VFTKEEAIIPIKCYSPELIVLSYESLDFPKWLSGFTHSIVIGPGLGRN